MWCRAGGRVQGVGEPTSYCSAADNVVKRSLDSGSCRMHWELEFSHPFGGMLFHPDER